MMSTTSVLPSLRSSRQKAPLIPNSVLGMSLFVISEIMLFVALISAFLVIKSGAGITWTPPGDIKLPVLATGFNTALLFISGFLLFLAGRYFADPSKKDRVGTFLFRAALFGSFFVIFQGYEWIQLIQYGMTMTSSVYGACFFLLIGCHGIHAAAAVLAMYFLLLKHRQKTLLLSDLQATQVFWFFVVGIWPILYGLVYF